MSTPFTLTLTAVCLAAGCSSKSQPKPAAPRPPSTSSRALFEDDRGLVESPLVATKIDRESLEILAKMSRGGQLSSRSFAALFHVVSPSVVNLFTSRVVKRVAGDEIGDDSLSRYEEFFGSQARENLVRSLGSGFIIDRKGYILTNHHVIENADEIRVRTHTGKELAAKVVGRDASTDIAIIKVKPTPDFKPVVFGDSGKVATGDFVAAIGNPFGLSHTMTVGIVSAKGRSSKSGEALADLIQTDATINPGNSGGPLLNLAGEVVGVNTSISALGKGIGFSIPINAVREVIAQLKLKGRIMRPWLGIYLQSVTPELAESFGLRRPRGALVAGVLEGTPSDRAGIKQGDIIVRWEGKRLRDYDSLRSIVHRAGVGRTVKVTVIREMKRFELQLPLEAERDDDEATKREDAPRLSRTLGLVVVEPTEVGAAGGLVVEAVKPQSAAHEAGIKVDDLVLSVNGTPVALALEFQAEYQKLAPGDICRLKIRRRGIEQFVAFRAVPQ